MSILNNSLLLGADAGAAGYQISRSLRFNSADSAFLSRTPASAGNRKTWTWSGWVKRAAGFTPFYGHIALFSGGTVTGRLAITLFNDTLAVDNSGVGSRATTAVFRDYSAWYHIVVAFDTTNATASDRIKFYINGVQQVVGTTTFTPALNTDYAIGLTEAHNIGRFSSEQDGYFSGYLADIHFIDGQALTPSSFAETNATTGQWVPKAYSGSYGTNGFRLDFSDNSAATATTLGKDRAGSNNWTPNNLSVTAGAGNDSLVDTPTSYGTDTGAGGEVRGNYCTMNPLDTASGAPLTLTNGNLEHANPSTNWRWRRATFAMTTGKWYWEQTVTTGATGSEGYLAGAATAAFDFNAGTAGLYARQSGTQYNNGTTTNSVFSSTTAGDILGFAFDADAGKLWVSQNGTFVGSPTAGTGNSWSNVPSGVFPLFAAYNVAGNIMNFGARSFAYTAPSGFKALCDTNLPAPVVAKPNTVMDVKLYTGNGGTQTISGMGFSPDLVWIKCRSTGGTAHVLQDVVRGPTAYLVPNSTAAENTNTANDWFRAFTSDGFTVAASTTGGTPTSEWNASSSTYVAWTWDAGSSTVTNTQGSITSSCRTNQSSGFSIATFTAPSSGSATIGHNLNAEPHMIIIKSRDQAYNWCVYHKALTSNAYFLNLNTTAAQSNASNIWNNTTPTSTVFSLGSGYAGAGATVAYLFSPVAGYSSFGSYVGNGATNGDGPFIYTGFQPRYILIRNASIAENWIVHDTARNPYNVTTSELLPNNSTAEGNTTPFDILSNGFKIRTTATNTGINGSGNTHICVAFAESPLQYARAR